MNGGSSLITQEQERIWRACRLHSDAAYNIASGVRIRGPINLVAAAHAVEHVMRRHVSLRSYFVEQSSRPVVKVTPTPGFPLTLVDLGRLDDRARAIWSDRLRQKHAARILPWDRPPLVAGLFLSQSKRDGCVSCVIHHLIADSWSMASFFSEFARIYGRFLVGWPAALPPIRFDYFDYARWQTEWLASEACARQRQFWKESLSRRAFPSLWQTKSVRRPRSSGGLVEIRLPGTVRAQLRGLERKWRVTLFMLLQAALHLTVQKWTGEPFSRIATPDGSRSLPDTEPLIGLFVNLLLLEAHQDPADTLAQFVQKVARHTAQAISNRDLPFGMVLELLDSGRAVPVDAVFQVALTLQSFDVAGHRSSALCIETDDAYNGAAKFPLIISARDERAAIRLTAQYATDRFDRLATKALLAQYGALLRQLAENPEATVSDLVARSPAERHWTLHEANDAGGEAAARRRGQPPTVSGRIEPEAIEQALRRHPLVADAAVVPMSSRGTGPRIGCFARLAPGMRLALDERLELSDALVRFLGDELPFGPTVSSVVLLDRFPLSPSGQTDKRALATMFETGAMQSLCGDLLSRLAEMSDAEAAELLSTKQQ